MTGPDQLYDVAVVGGGPAGLAASLALTRAGASVALISPPSNEDATPQHTDKRTAALFTGSIALLQNLGVWPDCARLSAPLHGIRIIDDTGGVLRAPEITFRAEEVSREVFGYNVPNAVLTDALLKAAKASHDLQLFPSKGATAVETQSQSVCITLAEGVSISARLVVGADGRNSICRQAAAIAFTATPCPQSALVCTFSHGRNHDGLSTEFHRPNGPLTTVPMPDANGSQAQPNYQSSLVWVESPDTVATLMGMDDRAFCDALSARLMGLLGALGNIGPRAKFPLSIRTAARFGANRIALVGESGHVIPPIGAQGLNLSLRDVATLADLVSDALKGDSDPGASALLQAYHAARQSDIRNRTLAVDMLNRSLTSSFLPVHLARGAGLHALNLFPALRRRVIEEGLHPSGPLPTLMRPNTLSELPAGHPKQEKAAHA